MPPTSTQVELPLYFVEVVGRKCFVGLRIKDLQEFRWMWSDAQTIANPIVFTPDAVFCCQFLYDDLQEG